MKCLVIKAELPLDAMYTVLARSDGQCEPSSRDSVGTEHKLGGRVALRPQDAT
jgi:hypothetical protein